VIESLATKTEFVRATLDQVSWQQAMQRAVRSASELCQYLGLGAGFSKAVAKAEAEISFPLFAPWEFIARMEPGNPHDPLLRQVLPVADELEVAPGYSDDPVGEVELSGDSLAGGVLRKYSGRALLIAHQACGVHCRYCFRRHFPYQAIESAGTRWGHALEVLASDASIEEIILSGGDPLVLTDSVLEKLLRELSQIPHLQRLRIHSRMPVVIPQRVTLDLVDMLRRTRLTPWFVIHANHAAELDHFTLQHLRRLIDAGIPVLNQAVLLRGVNDCERELVNLCRTLINNRIQPYYLHQLDRVQGAQHFAVSDDRALQLIGQITKNLPGYAVPKLVREVSGEASKTMIVPS